MTRAIVGDMVKATITAGIAASVGPSVGTTSKIPARSASGKAKGMPSKIKAIHVTKPIENDNKICPCSQAPNFSFTKLKVLRTFL